MKSSLCVLLIPLFFTACSKPNDTVTVQDLNRQFIDAWNSKSADKITGLLAEDVDFLQGNTHFKGKSEVSKKWVEETLPSLVDLKTNVVNSGTDSRIAYEAGTFSVDVVPTAANLPHGFGEGNYILLWKKADDGAWKLSYAQLEDLPVQAKR